MSSGAGQKEYLQGSAKKYLLLDGVFVAHLRWPRVGFACPIAFSVSSPPWWQLSFACSSSAPDWCTAAAANARGK